MSFITAVTHHLSYSHPPSFILPPSCPHHSALLLSILCSAPISPSFLLNLPLWCHCLFLSCRFGLICPLPLTLSFSHSGLSKSVSLAPFCRLVIYIHLFSYQCPLFLCFPTVSFSGQFIYGSAFIPETPGIQWTHQPN